MFSKYLHYDPCPFLEVCAGGGTDTARSKYGEAHIDLYVYRRHVFEKAPQSISFVTASTPLLYNGGVQALHDLFHFASGA